MSCALKSNPPLPKSKSHSPCYGGIFDYDQAVIRLEELNAIAENPELWNNPAKAQGVMRERTALDNAIRGYRDIAQGVTDNKELLEIIL